MKLVLLGPPGAGKGTVAKKLAKDFDWPHISTGDIFRKEIREGTDLGKLAASFMDKGNLVPDDVTMEMIAGYLGDEYILDGVPRTLPQAEYFDRKNIVIDNAVYLDVPDKNIVTRMNSRRVCLDCGATYSLVLVPPKIEDLCDGCDSKLIQREDDKPEAVETRLKIYHRDTAPLLRFYQDKGILKRVDGSLEPNKVYIVVKDLVKSLQP